MSGSQIGGPESIVNPAGTHNLHTNRVEKCTTHPNHDGGIRPGSVDGLVPTLDIHGRPVFERSVASGTDRRYMPAPEFRVWDGDEMIYVNDSAVWSLKIEDSSDWTLHRKTRLHCRESPDTSLMQHIGLADAEGKQIFDATSCRMGTGRSRWSAGRRTRGDTSFYEKTAIRSGSPRTTFRTGPGALRAISTKPQTGSTRT